MAKAQHRTAEYRQAEKVLAAAVRAGDAYCAEPRCLAPDRWISPETPRALWNICHDPTGTVIIGAGHRMCNLSEAAIRGNQMRGKVPRRWRL